MSLLNNNSLLKDNICLFDIKKETGRADLFINDKSQAKKIPNNNLATKATIQAMTH